MKVVSFNTNGIRARKHQLEQLVGTHEPDVIGIQETKVQDSEFPIDMIVSLGYQVAFHGQKGHYGVALLSKTAPLKIHKGLPTDDADAQRRLIIGEFQTSKGNTLSIINGYFPQGESRDHPVKFPAKQKFYEDLQAYLETSFSPTQPIVLMGDINVAPMDLDIGIGTDNKNRWLRTGKCSFLPEEREWLARLKEWGLTDTFRHCNPETDDLFSWFDYRSRGFERSPKRGLRIDVIMSTQALTGALTDSGISYDIRGMEKPSDHCPIWSSFDY
ncbi:MAG: exodeoxyribonuclease III [Pseudomonadota bacterium]